MQGSHVTFLYKHRFVVAWWSWRKRRSGVLVPPLSA